MQLAPITHPTDGNNPNIVMERGKLAETIGRATEIGNLIGAVDVESVKQVLEKRSNVRKL